ncbi:DUF732 domain-containing protein [Mycobacterium sp. Aquia_213]|uniref:DUF732 domain-containing protein n=1 Tax=Mycobacterium sp. Aquia_213 TaxID=2991728 RepID=UPI0022719A40|nr:DUF732 domain-containing protein [Mycobacterium sp. Aquia_213]WAC90250.1 DUF732 domain-containing protein [Mycobacterium sp. Aquia_213]
MTWTSLLKSAAIAAALTALASHTPVAHADPDPISVASYLATLNSYQVPYDNPGRMIDIANNVCFQARGGTNFDAIVPRVASDGYAPGQARIVIGAAVMTFCPDMQPALDRWIESR